MTLINPRSDQSLVSQLGMADIHQNEAVCITENKESRRLGRDGVVIYQSGTFSVSKVEARVSSAYSLDQSTQRASNPTFFQDRLATDIGKNKQMLQKLGEQRLGHFLEPEIKQSLGREGISSLVRNALDGLEKQDLLFVNNLNGDGLEAFLSGIDAIRYDPEFQPGYYAELQFEKPSDNYAPPQKVDDSVVYTEIAGTIVYDENGRAHGIDFFNEDVREKFLNRP